MNTQSTGEAIGERVVSSSAAMRFVMQEIARAAEPSVHVLLSGERGTGRETLARAIHARERHNHGAFVAIDCATFSARSGDVVCRWRLATRSSGAVRDRVHRCRGGASPWANTRSREKPGDSAQ